MSLRDGLIPEVKAEADGHEGWFKVDTGYNGSLALFADFVARHKSLLSHYSSSKIHAPAGQTIAGELGSARVVQIRILRLKALTSGGSKAQSSDTKREVAKPSREKGPSSAPTVATTLRDVPAALFTEKGGSNSAYSGAIGIVVLQNFRVTFNYPQRLMILDQR